MGDLVRTERERPSTFRVTVRLPLGLHAYADGASEVWLDLDEGATVRDLFDALATKHPLLVSQVLDESGRQRRQLSVFVGPDSIRALKDLETPLHPGADVTILAVGSGG